MDSRSSDLVLLPAFLPALVGIFDKHLWLCYCDRPLQSNVASMFTSGMFTSGNVRLGYAELESLITIDYLLTSRNQAKSQATLQATLRREACLLKVSKAQIAPWAIANLSATDDVSVSMEPGNSPQSRFHPQIPAVRH